jgi:hypothetical protein
MSNKNKQQTPTPPQDRFVIVPTQKTFVFKKGTPPEQMDEEVNKWIDNKMLNNQQPMMGKMCCNHATGEIMYSYIYPVKRKVTTVEPTEKTKVN